MVFKIVRVMTFLLKSLQRVVLCFLIIGIPSMISTYLFSGETIKEINVPVSNRVTEIFTNGEDIVYTFEKGNKQYLWYSEKEIGPFDEVFGVRWSPDNNTFTYSSRVDGFYYFSIGNETFGPYDSIGEVAFSGDSKHWACPVFINGKNYFDTTSYIYTDQQMIGPAWGFYSVQWFDEKNCFAYQMCELSDRQEIIVDTSSSFGFDVFGEDGEDAPEKSQSTQIVYRYNNYVVCGDEKYGPYENIEYELSPNKKSICVVGYGNDSRVVYLHVDKQKYGPFDSEPSVYWTEDEKNYAFWGSEGIQHEDHYESREFLYIGEKLKYGPYISNFGSFEWSPDGQSYAFAAYTIDFEQCYVFLNEQKFGPFDSAFIMSPAWDQKNKTLFFKAKLGEKWFLYRDGSQINHSESDDIFLIFSPNGESYLRMLFEPKSSKKSCILYRTHLESGVSVPLTNSLDDLNYIFNSYLSTRNIRWSPDGNSIAHSITISSTVPNVLFLNKEKYHSTDGSYSNVTFLPDNRTLTYDIYLAEGWYLRHIGNKRFGPFQHPYWQMTPNGKCLHAANCYYDELGKGIVLFNEKIYHGSTAGNRVAYLEDNIIRLIEDYELLKND